MLDSLVRVSRRVGGATDLLATEMRPASELMLAIRDHSTTRRARSPVSGARQAEAQQTSSTTVVRSQRFVA